MKFNTRCMLTLVLLPLFCAALGFSYALATANLAARASAFTAGGRRVGQDLRFTHPFIAANSTSVDPLFPRGGDEPEDPDGFDLGDAMAGSSILRYISAAGGFKPYNFEMRALLASNNLGGGNQPPQLPPLSLNGKFSGAMPQLTGNFTYFNVQLTDFIGTQRLGTFRLSLIQPNAGFRFAHDTLPTAQQGHGYYNNIPTIGGVEPISYSLLPGSVLAGATSFNSLEEIGLSLGSDGILCGRPLVSGAVTFSVLATDARGVAALGRAGTGNSQRFTLNVEQLKSAMSEIVTLQCAIKGSQLVTGADSFSYSGLVDTKGLTPAAVAGHELALRIGGAIFTGTFDERGRISLSMPNKGKFSVNFSAKSGRLRIKLSGADLTSKINASSIAGNSTLNVAISFDLPTFRPSEVLTLASRVRAGRYTLNYALGRTGVPAAGAFQIIDLKGTEGRSEDKQFGNRFVIRFYAMPRAGIDGSSITDVITGAADATIRIGNVFSQNVTLEDKVVRKEFKATSADPGLFRVLLDPKRFIHRIETNVLLEGDTNIPAALDTKDPTIFQLGVDIGTFSGDNGRVIVPNGKNWSER